MFGNNNSKGASGMIVMLQMMSQMIPMESQIEEVEDALKEYKIVPSEDGKKNLMSKMILLITTLKNDGLDIGDIMKEAMEMERKIDVVENITRPFDGSN